MYIYRYIYKYMYIYIYTVYTDIYSIHPYRFLEMPRFPEAVGTEPGVVPGHMSIRSSAKDFMTWARRCHVMVVAA